MKNNILKKFIIGLISILVLIFIIAFNYTATIKAQSPSTSTSASVSTSPSTAPNPGGVSTGGSADQEGGCEGEDTSCPRPNTLTPWAGDVKDSLSKSLKQSNITTAWGLTLDFINVIAIFALLAIAFANILHLDVETWDFKRMIPALVIALILANFSHLLSRAIIDFAAMLMNFFVPKNETMNVSFNLMTGMFSGFIQNPLNAYGAAGIAAFVVFMFTPVGYAAIVIAFLILFLPAVIILILFLLLAVRVYVIWFLVIVSPIAFFAIMFSVFQKQIQWWWTWFFSWVFMGPIVYFMIYIAEGFARSDMFQDSGGTLPCFDPTAGQQVGGFTKYLFVNALLVLAIIIPFMLGKSVFLPLWKYFGKYAAMGAGIGVSAGGTLATQKLGKGVSWAGKKIPGKAGALVGKLGKGMEDAIAPHILIPAAQGYLEERGKARVGAAAKQIQKEVEKLPGGRSFNRDMNREFGIKNGANFAQGSGWEVGSLGADEDRIVAAHLNAAPNKLGTNASQEDVNIIAFRMQRLRQLTGLDGRKDAQGHVVRGHGLLAFSDVYKPAKDLIDVEEEIHKKSGRRINSKKFKEIRKQVDEEVAAARGARAPDTKEHPQAQQFSAQDIQNGTAVALDQDLREKNLGYTATRRTI